MIHDIHRIARCGLMAGHGCGIVLKDNICDVLIVLYRVRNGHHAGVEKGGIAYDRHHPLADASLGCTVSYADAGVDIEAGNSLVERIKPIVKGTFRPGVLTGLGGFGALFELPLDRYKQPVLVSGTDGVGTKLKLALMLDRHDSIGIDLVAMCANDIVVAGAEPLFFLDYYATGRLDLEVATDVVKGIARGCELAGAALTGGETAEMPGMYADGDYDLAGFCVGIVEKDRIIQPQRVQPGDVLLGLASSGPHSNGYSLIRKILERAPEATIDDMPAAARLLAPTKIYVKPVLDLLAEVAVRGLAHITGGGITDNLGVRALYEIIEIAGGPKVLIEKKLNSKPPRRLVVISVNASTDPEPEMDVSNKQPSLTETISAISDVQLHRYNVATLELMDQRSMRMIEEFTDAGLPVDAGAALIVEVDGHPAGLDTQIEEVAELLHANGGYDLRIAQGEAERAALQGRLDTATRQLAEYHQSLLQG
mgnify:CR=1 FL=1